MVTLPLQMARRLAAILACLMVLSQQGMAITVSVPVDIIVSATRDFIELIVSEGKPVPDDIRQIYERMHMKQKADEEAHGSFISRIKLYGDRGPVAVDGRQVVGVTTNQISTDVKAGGVGRWIIWKTANGFSSEWLHESDAQKLFQDSNHSLPNAGVWKQPDVKHLDDIPARSMQYAGQTPPRDDPNLRGKVFVEGKGWVEMEKPSAAQPFPPKTSEPPPEAKQRPANTPIAPPRFEPSTWPAIAAIILACFGLLWLFFLKRKP